MDRNRILRALHKSWSHETSTKWSAVKPALGQCSVTALVMQDRFGGRLLKTRVGGAWHFYNEIDGQLCDFTAEQFDDAVAYQHVTATREEALADTSPVQVSRLAAAFEQRWSEEIGHQD